MGGKQYSVRVMRWWWSSSSSPFKQFFHAHSQFTQLHTSLNYLFSKCLHFINSNNYIFENFFFWNILRWMYYCGAFGFTRCYHFFKKMMYIYISFWVNNECKLTNLWQNHNLVSLFEMRKLSRMPHVVPCLSNLQHSS